MQKILTWTQIATDCIEHTNLSWDVINTQCNYEYEFSVDYGAWLDFVFDSIVIFFVWIMFFKILIMLRNGIFRK